MRKPFWTKEELADLKESEGKQERWFREGCSCLGIGCLSLGVSCFLPFLLLLK